MDGIRINDITLFMGKFPNRKQECFYFAEGANLYPVAYISKENLEEAKRLWIKMLLSLKKAVEWEVKMIRKLIKRLDRPLGLCITPLMKTEQHYKSSHPTNLYQALRLWLARRLIWWGYRLLLNNGENWVETC